MSDSLKQLDHLRAVTDEVLGGLEADDALRRKILLAAREPVKKPMLSPLRVAVPALCCAVIAFGSVTVLKQRTIPLSDPEAGSPTIVSLAAGGKTAAKDAADTAEVCSAAITDTPAARSLLLADADDDIPLISLGSGVYRMQSEALSPELVGEQIGTVTCFTEEPSLAPIARMSAGLSNVVGEDSVICSVKGLPSGTAVAARVGDTAHLFQRVSYAGRGPGDEPLENTLSVRGQVASIEWEGVGTLEGEAAENAAEVLLDNAECTGQDRLAEGSALIFTLNSGIRLQLNIADRQIIGCGVWRCPEFLEAFGR